MTFSRGDFWYAPNVKVNDIQDGPFGSGLSANDEESYYDFVFLKSLKWDSNNMTVNSSIDNIKSKDISLNDTLEINQDIADYQKMETLKDIDEMNTCSMNEGMSVVNNYLNNGLLGFNISGYIPTRQTYFSSLSKNNINNEPKQTVIYSKFKDENKLSDYLSINLHWYGIDFNLMPKLISNILIALINKGISKILSIIINKEVDKWIDSLALELKNWLFESAEELMGEIDADLLEDPEVIAILDPIYTVVSYVIANEIGKEVKKDLDKAIEDAVSEDKNTLRKLFDDIINPGVAHMLDKNAVSFELQISLHFLLFGSNIKLIPIYPPHKPASIIVPAKRKLLINKNNFLTGNTNNFTLTMIGQDWNTLCNLIKSKNPDALKILGIFNSNIILTNDEWLNLISQLIEKYKISTVKSNYTFILKVINKKISFSNIKNDGTTDIEHNSSGQKVTIVAVPKIVSGKILSFNNLDWVIENNQFGTLFSDYKYDVDNWNEISKKYPQYTFPYQYFITSELMNNVNIESNVDLFNIDPSFNKEHFWYSIFMNEFNEWCFNLFNYKFSNSTIISEESYNEPLFKEMVSSTNTKNNILELHSLVESFI